MPADINQAITGANHYIHLPRTSQTRSVTTIIFLVTGNPGIIKYYHRFLDLLHDSQSSAAADNENNEGTSSLASANCVVAGFSLGGFEVEDWGLASSSATSRNGHDTDKVGSYINIDDLLWPPSIQRKQLYNLRDQVELCYARLNTLVARVRHEYSAVSTTPGPVDVILMGHSVGAYIALELIRLHHDSTFLRNKDDDSTPPSHPTEDFTILSAILLTPTILNISHSSSGRIASPLLSMLPFLPALLQLGTGALTSLLPTSRLKWLVSRVTGMPEGSDALEATVDFLGSAGAVKEALFLAGREMEEIGGDTWGDEVWGVLGADGEKAGGWKAPKLYFWFAREDHWVADVTRREIVGIVQGRSVRGEIGQRAEVVIDEDEGLVHAWCIGQSEIVARRVRGWVEETLMRR